MTQPKDDLEARIRNLTQDHDAPPLDWDVLQDFADQLLSEEEREHVASQLVNNPESRRRLETILQADLAVKETPRAVDTGASSSASRIANPFIKWALPLAAVAAAAIVGIILFTSDPPPNLNQWSIQIAELAEDPNAPPSKSIASLHPSLLPPLRIRATEHLLIQLDNDNDNQSVSLTCLRIDQVDTEATIFDSKADRILVTKVLGTTTPGTYLLALSSSASDSPVALLESLRSNPQVRDSITGGLTAVAEAVSAVIANDPPSAPSRLLVLQLMP